MEERITKEELLERLFHDDYENLKGKRLRLTRVRVPGKELSFAHVFTPSDKSVYENLALHIGVHEGEDHRGDAIGMVRVTPWEAIVVAADVAVKAAHVEVGFMDRFCGTLILTGGFTEVSVGLACFSFEADVIAIVQAANEPFNLFSDGSRNFLLRPLIGIITKVDSPHANIPMVRQWMENMGCERIFMVNNKTREGISELMDYLKDDLPKLTLEQAKFKQSLGLNEWDPMPEGVEYPESIR